MNNRKLVIATCVVAVAATALIYVAADAGRHVRSLTKRPVTAARRMELERIAGDYKTAIFTWREQHDVARAKGMLQDLVRKREAPDAVFDLAALCTEQGNYKEALEYYRDALVRPHSWNSTEEGNPAILGAYVDVARKAGALSDAEQGEKRILAQYRPLGDEPPLIVDSSQPATIHAYACAARALTTRGEHSNGVAMAEEAVRARPRDGMLRWILGSVLFDAHRLPEAKEQLLLAARIGGLGENEVRILKFRMLQLNGTKAAESDKP